jgi:hypothetical protein
MAQSEMIVGGCYRAEAPASNHATVTATATATATATRMGYGVGVVTCYFLSFPLGEINASWMVSWYFALVACYFQSTRKYESRYHPCSVVGLLGCLRCTNVARKTRSANLQNKKVVD